MMDAKELRGLEPSELEEKAKLLTQELFNLRFQLATGRIENPMKVRHTKRDLARVKTFIRQKALAESGGKAAKE